MNHQEPVFAKATPFLAILAVAGILDHDDELIS